MQVAEFLLSVVTHRDWSQVYDGGPLVTMTLISRNRMIDVEHRHHMPGPQRRGEESASELEGIRCCLR